MKYIEIDEVVQEKKVDETKIKSKSLSHTNMLCEKGIALCYFNRYGDISIAGSLVEEFYNEIPTKYVTLENELLTSFEFENDQIMQGYQKTVIIEILSDNCVLIRAYYKVLENDESYYCSFSITNDSLTKLIKWYINR